MPELSLIISFYNKINYLSLVLAGLNCQTFNKFEVIIADDGSNEEAVNWINANSENYSFPIKHLWHEDKGFRKNKILNRAITESNSDYIIFIDGDCIPHSKFVEEHLTNRNKNAALTGRRVNLSEKVTSILTPKHIEDGFLANNFPRLIVDGIFGKSFDVEKGVYLRSNVLRNHFNKKNRGLLGCNFSLYKQDITDINGFDERYEAPSIGEDTDIQFRLELNNVNIISLNHIAVQYHLFHKLQERPQKNLDLFEIVKSEGDFFTKYGIIQEKV